MIEDILNIKPLFYISFIYFIIKYIKTKNITEEQLLLKEDTKKKKKEFRRKKRKMIRDIRKQRFTDTLIVNDSNQVIEYSSNDSNLDTDEDEDTQNMNNLKATSKVLSIEEKNQLIDPSLWDEKL
jgi:hypothetical protein